MGLFNFLTQEIAMDLGTANTLIIHNDEIVVNEPSIVALDRNNPKNVLAVGKRALMMHEKTHESIRTVRPLKDGVIADFNAAELMIREMIKMIYPKKPLFPPSWRMMICIPSSITEVEKRAVRDSAEQAGAKEVYLIHEPMAAALGIGIDVEEPVGNMIIDIGGVPPASPLLRWPVSSAISRSGLPAMNSPPTSWKPSPLSLLADRRKDRGADQDPDRRRPERPGQSPR